MAIREWHPGRIGLLWLAAALVTGFTCRALPQVNSEATASTLIVLAGVSLLLAFVVSWIWFGGHQRR